MRDIMRGRKRVDNDLMLFLLYQEREDGGWNIFFLLGDTGFFPLGICNEKLNSSISCSLKRKIKVSPQSGWGCIAVRIFSRTAHIHLLFIRAGLYNRPYLRWARRHTSTWLSVEYLHKRKMPQMWIHVMWIYELMSSFKY